MQEFREKNLPSYENHILIFLSWKYEMDIPCMTNSIFENTCICVCICIVFRYKREDFLLSDEIKLESIEVRICIELEKSDHFNFSIFFLKHELTNYCRSFMLK